MDDSDVFYFFKKGTDTITCEVRPSQRDPATTSSSGSRMATFGTETYPTSEAVHKRWLELLERFQHDGWWGPHIQDGRS